MRLHFFSLKEPIGQTTQSSHAIITITAREYEV